MLLALAALPGCLTQMIWEDETEPTTKREMVVERDESIVGELAVGLVESLPIPFCWRSADGGEVRGTLTGWLGEVAGAVLRRPSDYAVHRVTVESSQVFVDGRLADETDYLELSVVVAARDIVEHVVAQDLSAAALAVLASDGLADARLPAIYRDLVQQLPFADYAWLLGQPGVYSVASQVFLDEHGNPAAFDRADSQQPNRNASLAVRLAYLSRCTLVLRLQGPQSGPSEEVLVRVRPDRLWLLQRLTAMTASGPSAMRQSLSDPLAQVIRVPFRAEAPLVASEQRSFSPNVEARFVHRIVRFSEVTYYGPSTSFWTKLAWTPVTLAVDATVGTIWQCIAKVLHLDDDDDDDQ